MKTTEQAWQEIEELAADGLTIAICLLDIKNQALPAPAVDYNRKELKRKVDVYIVTLKSRKSLSLPPLELAALLEEVQAAL